MNAELVAYLAELRTGADGGYFHALRRCSSVVSKVRSPLDPQKVGLLKDFGEGCVSKRVRAHFANAAPADVFAGFPGGLEAQPSDLEVQVRMELETILASGKIGEQAVGAAMIRAVQQTRDALSAFRPLQDIRDLGMLRCCPPELAGHLGMLFKSGRKRKSSSTPSSGPKRKVAPSGPPNVAAVAGRGGAASAVCGGLPAGYSPSEAQAAAPDASTLETPPKRSKADDVGAVLGAAGAGAGPTACPAALAGIDFGNAIDVSDVDEGSGGPPAPVPPPVAAPVGVATPAKPQHRPCRPFSGGWAIMVALHIEGKPQTKAQLAELSAQHGLCREPLVKLQQTAGRPGQWYEPWSSCTRLRQLGWVVKSGRSLYALTDAGRVEAARYARERDGVAGQKDIKALVLGGTQPPAAPPFFGADVKMEPATEGAASSVAAAPAVAPGGPACVKEEGGAVAEVRVKLEPRPEEEREAHVKQEAPVKQEACVKQEAPPVKQEAPLVKQEAFVKREPVDEDLPSRCEATPDARPGGRGRASGQSRGRGRGRGRRGSQAQDSTRSQAAALGASVSGGLQAIQGPGQSEEFSVLVDVREQPVIRASLGRLLACSVELQVPGIDYSFGRNINGEWRLAHVLLERKTVFDFQATLSCQRAEFQARLHEQLQNVGFRVAIIVEGVNELKQHPLQDQLLTAAYANKVDVLTTASLTDTAELLAGFAAHAHLHGEWAVSALQGLLRPLYQADPASTCTSALTTLGIPRSSAESLTRGYGSLHCLLEQLPAAGGDAEAAVVDVASYGGLTLYQAGKALRALGLDRAPLLRKRRTRAQASVQPWEQASAWCWLPEEGQQGQAKGKAEGQDAEEEQEDREEAEEAESQRQAPQAGLPEEFSVEVGPKTDRRLVRSLKGLVPRLDEFRDLYPNTLRVCRGAAGARGQPVRVFGVSDGICLEPGKHWLVLPGSADWKEVARARARAYAQHGVVSSLCASPEQAAKHVAACIAALRTPEDGATSGAARRGPAGGRGAGGLAGVLCLARTAAGALPAPIAAELARRTGCGSVLQLVQKLRQAGAGYLQSLGIRDFGPERASAVKTLLLGE